MIFDNPNIRIYVLSVFSIVKLRVLSHILSWLTPVQVYETSKEDPEIGFLSWFHTPGNFFLPENYQLRLGKGQVMVRWSSECQVNVRRMSDDDDGGRETCSL